MSSSVCQGLQSCLEVVESRVLRLKLAPPKTILTEPEPMPYNEEQNANTNGDYRNVDMGGWSLLQSLSNVKVPTENENVYVHPLVKRSASRLSDKSLEMCTERLGSETGSEVGNCGGDDISLLSLDTQTVACNIPSKPRESWSTRKMSRSNSFPPPLTSISGSNYIRVKSHREGGRLVLQAISFPHCDKYLHAERSDGRLTLSIFMDDAIPVFEDNEEEDQEQQQQDEEEVYDEVEEDEFYGETENKEGNPGTGKIPRRCRCKQSDHKDGLLNWKPFLVAT